MSGFVSDFSPPRGEPRRSPQLRGGHV